MDYLADIDYSQADFTELYDELPLWSAPFGLLLLERAPLRRGMAIMDLGAGTGFLTVELAQRCGPDARVIAVDPWPAAMARLRRKIAHIGLANVELVQLDAGDLALPDSTLDLVVCNLGINNFEHPDRILRMCHRVLKPGGLILLTTNSVGHMAEFYQVYRATLTELGMTDRLRALDEHIEHRGSTDSVRAMLAEAGFAVRDTTMDSFCMRFVDGTALLRHYFIRLAFLPGWKSVVHSTSVERTFEALERNLNALAEDRGELALTVPVSYIEAENSKNQRCFDGI